MALHTIMYSSREVRLLTADQKRELLEAAREFNASHGITGMLLYFDRVFFQVIEGEESVIKALYESIKADPRHQNVGTVVDEPAMERLFPEWSMAYRALDGSVVSSSQQLEQMLAPDIPDDGSADRKGQRTRFLALVSAAANTLAA